MSVHKAALERSIGVVVHYYGGEAGLPPKTEEIDLRCLTDFLTPHKTSSNPYKVSLHAES